MQKRNLFKQEKNNGKVRAREKAVRIMFIRKCAESKTKLLKSRFTKENIKAARKNIREKQRVTKKENAI